MKSALILAVSLAALAGCASLEDAGHTSYAVEKTANGYRLNAADGKEYASRIIEFDATTGSVKVEETAAKAFKGQGVAAKAASVFPVTDLANIITGGDK